MGLMNNHGVLERHSLLLTIGILVVVSIGGIIQMAPLMYMDNTIEKVDGMRPYTPLELKGRQHPRDHAIQKKGRAANANCTCFSVAILRQRVRAVAPGLMDLSALSSQSEPQLRRSQRSSVRFEQSDTDAILQLRQRPAQAGLRFPKHFRALGQAALFDDRKEQLEMSVIDFLNSTL